MYNTDKCLGLIPTEDTDGLNLIFVHEDLINKGDGFVRGEASAD